MRLTPRKPDTMSRDAVFKPES